LVKIGNDLSIFVIIALFYTIFVNQTKRLAKKIIVSVISDLVTDQRVQKECTTLHHAGYEVLLVGRKSDRHFGLNDFPYPLIRFYNPFPRGPLMYLYFNLRLLIFLLFKTTDIFWANDLDTLLPNFLVARLKNKVLIYDSHEYFTESVVKPFSKKMWKVLEKWIFPKLKNVITVNRSIKNIYENKYRVPITVIRNVPRISDPVSDAKCLFPKNKKILIMQGMGLNENRGAEEAVLMMQYLPEDFNLYFIGTGTVLPILQQMVEKRNLQNKVTFVGPLPYQEMMQYTRQSYLGLIFEKIDCSGEHLYALPNRFFDYLHAAIPVLSSRAVEIETIVNGYNVGAFISDLDPQEIALKIMEISNDPATYDMWKMNTKRAAEQLNWQHEEKILLNFMNNLQ
jgi:glycosyltransferase involved in cell wall biosynthesis